MFGFLVSSIWSQTISPEDDEFEELFNKQDLFIKFTSPRCKICKSLSPIFSESSYYFSKTKFVEIDCNKSKELCLRFSVGYYPSFQYVSKSNAVQYIFNNSTSVKSLVHFVSEKSGEKAKYTSLKPIEINSLMANDFIKSHDCTIISYYSSNSIQKTNFNVALNNMTRIFAHHPNVAFGTVDCVKYDELCQGIPKDSLPTSELYTNNYKYRIDESAGYYFMKSINSKCGLNVNEDGYDIPQKCFNDKKLKTDESRDECAFARNLLPWYKSTTKLLQARELLAKALRLKEASFDSLNTIYKRLCAVEELISLIQHLRNVNIFSCMNKNNI